MSELDSISRVLGSIEANQKIANRQLETLFHRLDNLRTAQTEVLGVVREHSSRITVLETEVATDIIPTVEEIQRLKQRGVGILMVIGLLGTGIGMCVPKIVKYFQLLA